MSWPLLLGSISLPLLNVALVGFLLARYRRGTCRGPGASCPRCAFDLGPAPGNRCPECGCDLLRHWPRAGQRHRSRFLALVAALNVLACIGSLGVDLFAFARHGVIAVAPESALVSRATAGDDPSLKELVRRVELGQISDAHLDRLIAAGLAFQSEMSAAWQPRWGDLIEAAFLKGRLPHQAWRQYARNAFPTQPEFYPGTNGDDPTIGARVGPTRTGSSGATPMVRVRVSGYTLPGEVFLELTASNWASVRSGPNSQARLMLIKLPVTEATSALIRLRVEALDGESRVIDGWDVEAESGAGPMR